MAQQQSLGRTLSDSKHDLSSYSHLINRNGPLNHHNSVDATSTCSTTQIIRETGSVRSDTQLSDRSVHNRSSDSSSAHSLSNNSSGVTSSFRSDMPSAFGIVGAGEVRIVSFFYSYAIRSRVTRWSGDVFVTCCTHACLYSKGLDEMSIVDFDMQYSDVEFSVQLWFCLSLLSGVSYVTYITVFDTWTCSIADYIHMPSPARK